MLLTVSEFVYFPTRCLKTVCEMSSMSKFIVLKTVAKKYTYDILLPSKILYCTSSGQFTNPCGQVRGVVNGNEVKQLTLVGHMTMTMWRMYIHIMFILQTLIILHIKYSKEVLNYCMQFQTQPFSKYASTVQLFLYKLFVSSPLECLFYQNTKWAFNKSR